VLFLTLLNILYYSCIFACVCETVEGGVPVVSEAVHFESAQIDLFYIWTWYQFKHFLH